MNKKLLNDGTIYTGCTNDLEDRLRRHRSGQIHYTIIRLPIKTEPAMVSPHIGINENDSNCTWI